MTDLMQDHGPASTRIGWTRVTIGLGAGIAVWALTEAGGHKVWPATQPALFGALAMVALFVPFVVVGGLGAFRARTLAIWAAAVGLVMAALGAHDLARETERVGDLWVSAELMGFGAAGLFIAHHLVEAADVERRIVAPYPRYFDIAWKHGVQLVLSAAFVGVFWILLFLGGSLFELIGIKTINEVIGKAWFAFPATAGMFAAAVHLTDVRAGLIRGIRTVALTLLSWLMPVLAVLAGAFLLALPFTGLGPLWETRSAASILLSAAAILIVLINAGYQDGEPDQAVPLILRVAGRTAGLLLIPMVALAAFALWLRIGQHGLTPDRVVGLACVIAGTVYAVGYAAAAVRLGRWMFWVEKTNIAAAFVILALLLAIFSPLADPARLSVNDQMARLAAGKVTPETLDYKFLRFDGQRYGRDALLALKAKGGEAGRRAVVALADTNRWDRDMAGDSTIEPRHIVMTGPKGAALPDGFFSQDWPADERLICTGKPGPCEAIRIDLNADGADEVLVVSGLRGWVHAAADGQWRVVGNVGLNSPGTGEGIREALRAGRVKAIKPLLDDLEIDGRRFEVGGVDE